MRPLPFPWCGSFLAHAARLRGSPIYYLRPATPRYVDTDGSVSWPFAVNSARYPSYAPLMPAGARFRRVLHLVRCPMATVSAFQSWVACCRPTRPPCSTARAAALSPPLLPPPFLPFLTAGTRRRAGTLRESRTCGAERALPCRPLARCHSQLTNRLAARSPPIRCSAQDARMPRAQPARTDAPAAAQLLPGLRESGAGRPPVRSARVAQQGRAGRRDRIRRKHVGRWQYRCSSGQALAACAPCL